MKTLSISNIKENYTKKEKNMHLGKKFREGGLTFKMQLPNYNLELLKHLEFETFSWSVVQSVDDFSYFLLG